MLQPQYCDGWPDRQMAGFLYTPMHQGWGWDVIKYDVYSIPHILVQVG